ncbi:MAG: AbrB/MazE/SpoVT family DNA-binding domain-containing protein [Leptospirillum sp.]|jgi:AbrB family looped-hinge helix DNA binding protein
MISMDTIAQIGARGQLTLPASARKKLGLKTGDTLLVHIEGGRIVLDPAVVLPVEIYTEKRIAEFAEQATMTTEELEKAQRYWEQ